MLKKMLFALDRQELLDVKVWIDERLDQLTDNGNIGSIVLTKRELELAQSKEVGDRLTAIKMLRDRTNLGLREAKELVDKNRGL